MTLRTRLQAREFVLLAEVEPPKGVDIRAMVDGATRIKGLVDAFLVPELSSAVMRMSSLGAAVVLGQSGVETVLQIGCRDRNRLALQADVLSAAACGISSILVVAGEDPSLGDHVDARPVFDVQPIDLLRGIAGLQSGRDMAGIELAGAPQLFVGASVEIGVPGRSAELEFEELKRMAQAGAQFFVSPPVFDVSLLLPFAKRVADMGHHLLPTVLLLKSFGMARYIARNVPRIHIPEAVITRLQQAPDRSQACLELARETIATLRDAGLGGVVISTLGSEDKLPEVLWGHEAGTKR